MPWTGAHELLERRGRAADAAVFRRLARALGAAPAEPVAMSVTAADLA
ncbi:hypothetical protein [Actinomadura atramentaria]|nr:hypothetical protein [Actinomadura atramentaria]